MRRTSNHTGRCFRYLVLDLHVLGEEASEPDDDEHFAAYTQARHHIDLVLQ